MTEEGHWKWWSNNHQFSHNNWLVGEPNNGHGSSPHMDEDCLLYNWSGLGEWADAPCSWTKPFICSKEHD